MSNQEMLSPQNAALALIDFQPAMFQGVQSHDRKVIVDNVQVLAKAGKLFGVPTIITTVAKASFSGPFMPEVTEEVFPDRIVGLLHGRMKPDAKERVMAAFARGLPPDLGVRFVSFTVDPDHDTPEVLQKYAASFKVPDPSLATSLSLAARWAVVCFLRSSLL